WQPVRLFLLLAEPFAEGDRVAIREAGDGMILGGLPTRILPVDLGVTFESAIIAAFAVALRIRFVAGCVNELPILADGDLVNAHVEGLGKRDLELRAFVRVAPSLVRRRAHHELAGGKLDELHAD